MAGVSEPRSNTPVIVVVVALALAIGGFLWWRRADKPVATAPSAEPQTTRAETEERPQRSRGKIDDPEKAAAARKARNEMRERIIEALKKKGMPTPEAAARAAKPASTGDEKPARHQYEPSYIQQAVRQDIFPLVKECYEQALKRSPKLRGRVIVNFTLVGDPEVGGVVDEGDIDESSDLKDAEMSTCVRESFMTLTLDKPPAGGGTVTVKYPILFSPGDEEDGDAGSKSQQGDAGSSEADER
jgi:hypothetical protein